MSAADELDEVPDAASSEASAEELRRDVRQAFRAKHGRDPTEEEVHSSISHLTIASKEQEGRESTLDEYSAICESDGIPAAHLQSYLAHRGTVEGQKLAEAAFVKEHGREPTDEEAEKFSAATRRDDPMDRVGPVEAEEADTYRRCVRLRFMAVDAREPTDDELSSKNLCVTARIFRRAALEAVNPDVAAVRRILVSRNVAAAKRDDAPPAVVYGPPPRPEDAEAAESPFERAARLEHDKVLVVAAAAYQTMCTLDDAAAERHHQNLRVLAKSDETWDKQTEVARGVISGLGDKAPCRFSAAFAVNAVIGTGNSTAWPGDATDIYATSYATLLERTAREILDPGADIGCLGSDFDMPSLSSEDAADIVPSVENTSWDDEEGCIVLARGLVRLFVLDRIDDAVREKKKHDAAVEREAARVRLKQREASSRKAEADLLALLDAEDNAGAAPKSKKKKKKKKKRGESPVPMLVAAPETKAVAPEAPGAPADAAAEAKPPEKEASEAAPEEATEKTPTETASPPEAPASEPDADAPLSATGERRRSLADLAAAVAAPAPAAAAPPEEDAWETVARRPRQTAVGTPPPRRRSDHADAPKHAVDNLLALEATGGALTDHALRKLGAFGGRCYVTQKGDVYQPITDPRRRHYERSLAETKGPEPEPDAGPASLLPLLAPKDDAPAVDAPSPSPQFETTPPPPAPAPAGLDPDVARFLDNLGLAGVGPILAREEIDWETLGLLDAEGLTDAGIPRDDAQFIIVAYASLGGAPPTPAPGTPERDECPICFEPEKSTALVPCGHILCGACAVKYANCPVCREPVASRMRVFW